MYERRDRVVSDPDSKQGDFGDCDQPDTAVSHLFNPLISMEIKIYFGTGGEWLCKINFNE